MKHPKHLKFINDDYTEYILKQDCCVIGCAYKPDPHHVEHARINTYMQIPMCRAHHTLRHTMPREEFEEKYGVNIYEEVTFYLMN